MKMKRVLVLSAHPDDETLGLGGTIAKMSKNGDIIYVLVFADGETARKNNKLKISERRKQAKDASKVLGIKQIEFLNYEDQKLDTIPLVELSKHIENAIRKWNPNVIFTHFYGDVNQDHKAVFDATLIATRPTPKSKITEVICYETPSSTEWGIQKFNPNFYEDISKFIKTKQSAFKKYKGEIEMFPHPRSLEAIFLISKRWGSTIGLKHAEAFLKIREISK